MSKIIYANELQVKVLNSEKRVTVITAEPGAGSTCALILKAIQACSERKVNCTFFIPNITAAHATGGVVDSIKEFTEDRARFSEKSLIFTFPNGSKIKLVSCQGGYALEATMGFDRTLMLFDANIPDKFIEFHLPRAYEAVVVDSVCEIEKEDSWANKLGLLKKHKDTIIGFVDGINHVTGSLQDNFLFENREKYYELVKTHIPEKMRTEF